ncbi:hypothetical protein KI387_028307, partial [Taxus chinensis]
HLQASCPVNKNQKSTKKNGSTSSSGWGSINPDLVSASNFKDVPNNPTPANKVATEKEDTEMGTPENHMIVGGMKRGHTSESSESDRDFVSDKRISSAISNDLALVISTDQGKWFEVKTRRNKKGRMGSIEDYFPS